MRFGWTVLFGVLGVLVGAVPAMTDHLEKTPLGTGYNSGLSYRVDPDGTDTLITMNTEATDQYLLRLKLRDAMPAATPLHASLNGRALACVPGAERDDRDWYELCDGAAAGKARNKFDWPSGNPLLIKVPGRALTKDAVEDWVLYPDHHGPDSATFMRHRGTYEIVFWAVAGLSLLVAIATFVHEQRLAEAETAPLTAAFCVGRVIDRVGVENPATTKHMRTFLHNVMDGMDVNQALESVGMKPDRAGKKFMFAAVNQLKGILGQLISELQSSYARVP